MPASQIRCRAVVALAGCVMLLPAPPARSETLTLPLEVPNLEVATAPDGTATFDCPAAQWLNRPGEPAIPWHVMTILLPPDVDLQTISVALAEGQWQQVQGTWTVAPTPPVATWHDDGQVIHWPADKTIVDGRDVAVYAQDALWPAIDAQLLTTGRLRKYRLAQAALPLAKYNPTKGTLHRLTGGQVVVRFEQPDGDLPAAAQAELSDPIGEDRVRRIVVNFEQQSAAYRSFAAGEEEGGSDADGNENGPVYLIIVSSTIASTSSALVDFVAHKRLYGFNVQVITENDFGGGTGDTAAENIRAWLQAHYVSDGIEHVLLIGSPHPGTGDVPMKMFWPRYDSSDDRQAPSDFYYADLTGNWDRDGDGYYGEWGDDFGSGGIDRNAEVLVGRIPYYGNVADVDHVLWKIINYELQPDASTAWRKNVLLPMVPSDGSTPGYHLGEQIKDDFLVPAGWSYHRLYEDDYGLVPPPETTPCTVSNVTDVWSNGTFGLIIWWTHGWSGGATDVMDNSHALQLNDAYPGFTFQVSCTNARPEGINLAAVLLKNGAVCTIGATRSSWYYIGQTSFNNSPSNSGMSYEYAERMVDTGRCCGDALYELKSTLYPTGSSIWMNFVVFNIYGDSSVPIIPEVYPLHLDIVSGANGSVQLDPEPNEPYRSLYATDTVVTLTAVPDPDQEFEYWKIYDPNHPDDANYAASDANTSITVVMDRCRQVEAVFKCGGGSVVVPSMLAGMALLGMVRLRRRR